MNTYVTNTIYLGVFILVAMLVIWAAPSQSAMPAGIVLPLTKFAVPAKPIPIQVFDEVLTPSYFRTLGVVNYEYHVSQTRQNQDKLIAIAKGKAASVGANALIVDGIFYDQSFQAYHLTGRAILY